MRVNINITKHKKDFIDGKTGQKLTKEEFLRQHKKGHKNIIRKDEGDKREKETEGTEDKTS